LLFPNSFSSEAPRACTMPTSQQDGSFLYYRHTLPVRIMHWVNVVAFFMLLMSGLQTFNAHPTLNWGAVIVFRAAGGLGNACAANGGRPIDRCNPCIGA
jgi:hypothetical protein